MRTAAYWIKILQLQEHPEGGFFSETYRSPGLIPVSGLPPDFKGSRNFSTAIYFLLRSEDHSKFHRIKSDEIWHHYNGTSLSLYVLDDRGLSVFKLGQNPERGESLQVVIPANCWFGAQVNEPDDYVLSGCTVAPGFDFLDFELADRDVLLRQFPGHKEIITLLT